MNGRIVKLQSQIFSSLKTLKQSLLNALHITMPPSTAKTWPVI